MTANVKWMTITEQQGHKVREAFMEQFRSFSSCTDPYGQYGSPSITDEWCLPGADLPMLKAYSKYQYREDFKEGQDFPERLSTQYYIAIITEVEE
ncbi:MAG: hypothetical protein M3Y08_01195 [Fibrobacterota bacterium]|nr:hypothetical protein [Fibrobacterota bacterium]